MDVMSAVMGTTAGPVTVTCSGGEAEFREGELTQVVLAITRLKFGPGGFPDHQGFQITERSTLLAGRYDYWLAAPDLSNMNSVVLEMLRTIKEVQPERPTSRSIVQFSAAPPTAVDGMLRDLVIGEVHGHELYPLSPPSALPSDELEDKAAEAFCFERYPDEDAAAADLMEYHREHLQLYGIELGRGGFAVRDLHDQHPLHFTHNGRIFRGGVDSAVVPYGVGDTTAPAVMRIAWQHKQSSKANRGYQDSHLVEQVEANVVTGPLAFDDARPQAICAVLAGAALCQAPLLVDVTDGEVHHLLRLQGQELVVHEDCTPQQAYSEMARWLKEMQTWAAGRAPRSSPPHELPDDLARTLKKLKQDLLPGESLLEHMSDIETLSGYDAAYDFALGWAPGMVSSLPDCVRSMFDLGNTQPEEAL